MQQKIATFIAPLEVQNTTGVTVARFDENGNLAIKGRLLKI